MIPEFDPEDYDEDNNIDEKLLILLALLIPNYEKTRVDMLVSGATKNYLNGATTAYKRLKQDIIKDELKTETEKYLAEYKKGLLDGYTKIQGKKVYWLRDRTLNERQKIFDIINEGIQKEKSTDILTSEIQEYFGMQKTQAQVLAINETAYVKARARDIIYHKYDVEEMKWLLGSNPCEICIPFGGQIYTWDTLPYEQPVHIRCNCDLEPVLKGE